VLGGSKTSIFIKLNPMYYFVTYFRDCLYNCNYLGLGVPSFSTLGLLYLFGLISIALGFAVYKPLQKHFITNI